MEESTANPGSLGRPWKARGKTLFVAGIVAGIILLALTAGFVASRAWSARESSMPPVAAERLSADELEARYGLRVRLIGVTAGGGMIDFRLKILDAKKAGQLLLDPARKPSLIALDSDVVVTNPADLQEDPRLEDGGIFFVLFPNSGGAIQPGDEVIVAFGDLQLEPMPAQ